MGLTTRDWVTIGLALWTVVLAVISFAARRFLRQVDQHGTDIASLRDQLGSKVSRDTHDVANAEIAALVERMRNEANARETRILSAIERARDENSRENRDIRREVSVMHQRIDRIRDSAAARRG